MKPHQDQEKYAGMGIFKEARERKKDGMGYRSNRYKIIWQGKKASWQHVSIQYGIRWSDQWQFFPIKNMSNNSNREIQLGIWKLYISISYHRSNPFNQHQNKFLLRRFRKTMQLLS